MWVCAAPPMAVLQPQRPCNHRIKLLSVIVRPMLHLIVLNPAFTTNTNTDYAVINTRLQHNSPTAIDLNGDIITLCKQGRLKEALRILDFMDNQYIRPDSSTYESLLQECVNQKALQEGKLIHAHMIATGFNPDIFLGTKLVVMYAKCAGPVDARRVFDEMPKRHVTSWNVMIAAYARHGYHEDALALFRQMQATGAQPDEFTFSSVLTACANLAALEQGRKIHEDLMNRGFLCNTFVGSALVGMYAKCGRIEDACHVFDEMSERDLVSWNAMIAGYAQNGDTGEALKLFQKTSERNTVSWNAMIAGCAQNGRVGEALRLFQKMPEPSVVSWTAMITGYANNGHLLDALGLFQKMPERNVVSWTAMITGYAQNGYSNEALNLFRQLQLTDVKLVGDTFGSVLPACAKLSALKHGKEAHEHIIKSGFESHMFVGCALVDMYAKCGSVEDACHVFDKMPQRNVVSWNAMIAGYAMHGFGKEALQRFEQMQHSSIRPDHVTFIGVLSACCHSGLVADGWQYFASMSRDYGITPTVEHYSCMIDILGRAGHLDEAYDLVNKMPVKPTATVWGSLLCACRIHANTKLGELVAKHLFELEPKNAANYVLLSNIYAAAGRWEDAEKVQKLRIERRITKTPGCSWIEVNNKVYSFVVNDRSHPQMTEVYAELERLSGQMKEAGYLPDTNLVMHDVPEEQKEHIICHHSEKLAIVFGLIYAYPRTPIRITKNLRVCGDCHSAIKFISKIVAREIVVRDSHRFHHFTKGVCSCGDYW